MKSAYCWSERLEVWKQAIELALDHGIAFADATLEAGAVEDFDGSVAVTDQSGGLQLQSGFSDPGPAHAQHVGNQLLGHAQLVGGQAVQAQEEPAANMAAIEVAATDKAAEEAEANQKTEESDV